MDRIKFKINGVSRSVGPEVNSTTTLLDYIRNWLELRGTKYQCLEGGCGACIVSVVRPCGAVGSVNSCLVSVTSCYDWDITTIEGIGNRLKGYHILQKALAEQNGTQCGYCSPGWVMAMYSLLKRYKSLTMLEIEESLASNMCRCTGYRPILDAFTKFASDAPPAEKITIDIEDLDICKSKCSKDTCDDFDWCFVRKEEGIINIKLKDKREWFRVQTAAEIFSVLNEKGDDSYMLVGGNTGKGVIPILEYPRLLIDISDVTELIGYYFDQNLVIGAGTTLTQLLSIFRNVSSKDDFEYLEVLYNHVNLVAHVAVRNIGTIGGNLMLKHMSPEFTSDIFLILHTVGAGVTIMESGGKKTVLTLDVFLRTNMRKKLIYNVLLPPLNRDNRVITYKIRPRAQNAHAIVNAGFVYNLNKLNQVRNCRIIFTGLLPGFTRASKTELYLMRKNLFLNETLQTAVKILFDEIVAETRIDGSAEYRKKVALGLFYKSLLYFCPKPLLHAKYQSGAINLYDSRPVSSGKEFYTTDPSVWPLTKPIPKIEALIQCAGETSYTEDLPSISNEVFAALVLSNTGVGKIGTIDASRALAMDGVIAFYSAKDIPGLNAFFGVGNSDGPANEVLFSDGDIDFYNQPVGVIVAETRHIAEVAAQHVDITYSFTKRPILNVSEAKMDPSRVRLINTIRATDTGNEVVRVVKGTYNLFGQYHFCYENIACVCWPTEEGLAMRSATQCTFYDQAATAQVLNIDQSRVDVITKRVGGAFGLKISRQLQTTTACNLAVYKLNRPCRLILPLRTTVRTVGKRFSSSSEFEIGVNKNGIIQYINYTIYEDNGYMINEPIAMKTFECYSNYFSLPKITFTAYNVITNKPSNTYCRSPATVEVIGSNEVMMEKIAYEMDLDPVQLRLNNADEKYRPILSEMVENLKINANYIERKAQVNIFNKQNRWKKRGLRFVMMKWNSIPPFYADVNLAVLQKDGTVVIAHGGIEMGQGVNTKITQICAYFLNLPIDKIIIKAQTTTIAPNSMPSVGSAVSQMIGLGVQRACIELLHRLKPVREELNHPDWVTLIKAAYDKGIDLQAHGFVNSADVQNLDIFGVTLAEVEIDVLTGEWLIIRVDLSEDVGRSVSPIIDMGQIHGAFIMGVGYYTTEALVYDNNTGEILSDRTWNYKIPQARDTPVDFRVYFKPNSYSNDIVLGSKVTGEPATVMGIVVPFAMREAIVSAREDTGLPSNKWFDIDGPFTLEEICLATCTNIEEFKYN